MAKRRLWLTCSVCGCEHYLSPNECLIDGQPSCSRCILSGVVSLLLPCRQVALETRMAGREHHADGEGTEYGRVLYRVCRSR